MKFFIFCTRRISQVKLVTIAGAMLFCSLQVLANTSEKGNIHLEKLRPEACKDMALALNQMNNVGEKEAVKVRATCKIRQIDDMDKSVRPPACWFRPPCREAHYITVADFDLEVKLVGPENQEIKARSVEKGEDCEQVASWLMDLGSFGDSIVGVFMCDGPTLNSSFMIVR